MVNIFFELQCNYACITLIKIPFHTSSVSLHLGKYSHMCMYTYANHMYTYSYVVVIRERTYSKIIIQITYRNIMIILIRAHYYQNAYLYMYAYIRHPKVFTSSPHTHCYQLPSFSNRYLFTCNAKK